MRGITVKQFYELTKEHLKLRLVAGAKGLSRRITVPELNRPGLAFAGYFSYFASRRPQVLGMVETHYLQSMEARLRRARIRQLLRHRVPCVILTRNYRPPQEMIEEADREKVPFFRSPMVTMALINKATIFLEDEFSPSTSVGANLLEVFGVGVLICGRSGVGKSECALGLIKRGHRLIADDVVKVQLREGKYLIGTGAEIVKHHMEIRGLGIINVQDLYGATCVKEAQEVELAVSLEEWDSAKEYERLGLEDKTMEILGQNIPHLVIPVRPGRDIVLLLETAALNHRLKKMGKHAAKTLDRELIEVMSRGRALRA
ncbi:MAG: HPr(Ser) kinase/phosphatase [Candidatus Aureabacteria bacterium]|nr:HPr(Ser) kinase/phosphatase [Candidatus Auribacterota bacterium]